jgi:hypothetical protein
MSAVYRRSVLVFGLLAIVLGALFVALGAARLYLLYRT